MPCPYCSNTKGCISDLCEEHLKQLHARTDKEEKLGLLKGIWEFFAIMWLMRTVFMCASFGLLLLKLIWFHSWSWWWVASPILVSTMPFLTVLAISILTNDLYKAKK